MSNPPLTTGGPTQYQKPKKRHLEKSENNTKRPMCFVFRLKQNLRRTAVPTRGKWFEDWLGVGCMLIRKENFYYPNSCHFVYVCFGLPKNKYHGYLSFPLPLPRFGDESPMASTRDMTKIRCRGKQTNRMQAVQILPKKVFSNATGGQDKNRKTPAIIHLNLLWCSSVKQGKDTQGAQKNADGQDRATCPKQMGTCTYMVRRQATS